ncbi:MAG: FIST signal transduction protein [Acidimicrobiia bacterium]
MELETVHWEPRTGWSTPLPELDSAQTLVLAFGSPGLLGDPRPFADLKAAFPSSVVTGCSTAGEILDDMIYDDSLTVAIAKFASTRLTTAAAAISDPAESYAVGARLAADLKSVDGDLRAIFVLSDGISVNGSQLAAGLVEAAGPSIAISGGLAADGDRFERTWLIESGEPRSGVITAVGLGGHDLTVTHGSKGGWDIFGPQRLVTRSKGNVLYELDGQPALSLYKRYLGDRAAGLPATALLFPLSVQLPSGSCVTRTILSVNEEEESMLFAGDVPEGSMAQLMRANFDRIIAGANEAAAEATDALNAGDDPVLAIAISCVGRRLLLGARTEDELEATKAVLPPDAALIGFYSYGELSTVEGGHCELHNQTMTLTTISEAA